jgi:hypothetical protein
MRVVKGNNAATAAQRCAELQALRRECAAIRFCALRFSVVN